MPTAMCCNHLLVLHALFINLLVEESAARCGVFLSGVVLYIATASVIADCIGIDRAVLVAGAAWDGVRALQHGFQLLLAVYAFSKIGVGLSTSDQLITPAQPLGTHCSEQVRDASASAHCVCSLIRFIAWCCGPCSSLQHPVANAAGCGASPGWGCTLHSLCSSHS